MLGVWKVPTIPAAKEGSTPLTSRVIKVKARLNIHTVLEVDAGYYVGDWRPGDELLLTSTDFDAEQAERRAIVSVRGARIAGAIRSF